MGTKVESGVFLAGQWGECTSVCRRETVSESVECRYERQQQAAIPGYNIKKFTGMTVQGCQDICSDNGDCKAVEFATQRDAGGSMNESPFYVAGTCLLQSTDEGVMPPANRYKNLDLYIKYSCKPAGGAGRSGGNGGSPTPANGGAGGREVISGNTEDITIGGVGAMRTTLTTTTSCPFDCGADYDDWPMQWVKGWSGAKKLYCCRTANRGCPDELPKQTNIPQANVPGEPDLGPYNCHAAYQSCYSCIVAHWSTLKINFCCREHNIGCKPGR